VFVVKKSSPIVTSSETAASAAAAAADTGEESEDIEMAEKLRGSRGLDRVDQKVIS